MDALTPALRRARLAELREDAAFRAREREEAAAGEARRDETEASLRAYYAERGEWPTDTIRRQLAMQSQHDEAERRDREEKAAEKRADDLARLQLQGYRPRTVAEVLATARGAL